MSSIDRRWLWSWARSTANRYAGTEDGLASRDRLLQGRGRAIPGGSPIRSLDVDQGGDCRMAAQLLQAAGTMGPDAADRDAQLDADLGVRHRRILDEQCDQPPGVRVQLRKRLAQRGRTLGSEQFRLHRPCHRVGYPCVVLPVIRSLPLLCRTQDPATFPAGGGGEPAGKCGWLAYGREVTN